MPEWTEWTKTVPHSGVGYSPENQSRVIKRTTTPISWTVTSLLQQISELDRATELKELTLQCYASAVQTAAQYAVEVERPLAEAHRSNMEAVRHQILSITDARGLQETKSALRAELRDYRDKCERDLGRLRQEFMAALVSLQEVMSSAAGCENDHEKDLTVELQALQRLAATADPDQLREGVNQAVRNITSHVEKLRSQMELTVAQFKDEIRVLQRRLHDVEASTAIDPQTGALNRKQFESRVRKYVLTKGDASIAFIKAKNVADVERVYGSELAAEALSTMYKRLRVSVGEEADVGRWTAEVFAVKLVAAKSDAMRLSNDLARKLSGTYVCMQAGRPIHVALQAAIGVADCRASEDPDQFLARVEQLTRLLH